MIALLLMEKAWTMMFLVGSIAVAFSAGIGF